MSIISYLIIGRIAGFLARLLVPGRDPMGIVGTLVLGLVGAFVGGFLFSALFGSNPTGALDVMGIIGATVGAIVALLVYRAVTGRRTV